MTAAQTATPEVAQPTPAEAAAQLVVEGRTSQYSDKFRRLTSLLLSEDDLAGIVAKARKDNHWRKGADLDRTIRAAQRDAQEAVAEFLVNGEDTRWFLLGLERTSEIELPSEIKSDDCYRNFRKELCYTNRRVERSDAAALLAVHKAEAADELEWRLENEPDGPMRWAEGYGVGKADTKHGHMQQRHDETYADAEKYMVAMTPYRLWSIVKDIEEWAIDQLRQDLCALYGNSDEGESLGRTLSKLVTSRFENAVDALVAE
ncbi:hypothetical protein N9917_00485 [Deltaproteobacteria bacterium]|nr:hypothetical protein [Deltaproteobacteria bacterium]